MQLKNRNEDHYRPFVLHRAVEQIIGRASETALLLSAAAFNFYVFTLAVFVYVVSAVYTVT